MYGCVGHCSMFADTVYCPTIPCFYVKAMSINITNLGGTVNYHDNHKEITINNAKNTSDIVRQIMADDIEPVQEVTPSDLPFLVVPKLKELNLYSLEEFEDIYRKAVQGDAKTLASFLKKYRDLQVLDFGDKNKKQIFAELEDFFGDSIDYKYPNFAAYF